MIAYYALLSFVPLTFITFALLGFFGRAHESDALVKKLSYIFPDKSLSTIATTVTSPKMPQRSPRRAPIRARNMICPSLVPARWRPAGVPSRSPRLVPLEKEGTTKASPTPNVPSPANP